MAQESLQAREPGFYWVKIKYDDGDDWEIARWNAGWELCSNPDGYWSAWLEKIIEVDERRIERGPPPGAGARFRVNTEIVWHVTCWIRGPLTEDGCETTCLLEANHDGEHEWIRNDQIRG